MQKAKTLFFPVTILLLLIIGYLHPVTALTQDLGRHILTGQIILDSGSVPKTNLYSYTYPDFPFINHHWLSEVLFFLQSRTIGFAGLQLVGIAAVLIAFANVFFFAAKRASPILTAFLAIMYLNILFERTDIRPELYSFLFLSFFITTLYSYREKFTKWIFLLVPLTALWVNMHIYFFVGIVVLALFVVDDLIVHRKKLWGKHTKILLLVFFLSSITTLINPNGIDGALYPLRVFENYGYTIEENQTIMLLQQLGFQKPSFPYFFFAVMTLFTALTISFRKTRPIDWFLSLAFALAGFLAVRNLPLFVFATLIPAAIHLTNTLIRIPVQKDLQKKMRMAAFILLVCIIAWQFHIQIQNNPIGLGVAKGAERGADFFLKNNLKGPIFNNFDIGSYLAYRLYPDERVFIDGRPEAYPAEFIQNTYMPMQQDPRSFQAVSDQHGFNAIFFSHTDQTPWGNQFFMDILKNPSWKPVYLDDTVIILVKNTPQNKELIATFGMEFDRMTISHFDPQDFTALLRLASFFNKTGQVEQELLLYRYILAVQPDFCPALYNATAILSTRNDPGEAIYSLKYRQYCS